MARQTSVNSNFDLFRSILFLFVKLSFHACDILGQSDQVSSMFGFVTRQMFRLWHGFWSRKCQNSQKFFISHEERCRFHLDGEDFQFNRKQLDKLMNATAQQTGKKSEEKQMI